MFKGNEAKVAIVDHGLGNLFSVKNACAHVGMRATVTSKKVDILGADLVILPGMGAFGDAMEALHRLDLVEPLHDVARSGKPLIGVCLGLQLFMTEGYEFGRHQGLGLIEGPVMRFENPRGPRGILKVPQVGWNRILHPPAANGDPWADSPLEGLDNGEFMYFVHSFYARPEDPKVVLSTTRYGDIEFCSSVRRGNVVAFQYHPERSGVRGLKVYCTIAAMVRQKTTKE